MKFDNNTALVLEGGGLRGVFTCGVLDCFMNSIPVRYAMEQGYEKLVVILTRNKGYRKKEGKMPISRLFYRKYPKLQKALDRRNQVYNKTMEKIEMMEDRGEITVIRPIKPITVGRMEKDTSKLSELYQEGYDIAKTFYDNVLHFGTKMQ